jgi:hypothetical protein
VELQNKDLKTMLGMATGCFFVMTVKRISNSGKALPCKINGC